MGSCVASGVCCCFSCCCQSCSECMVQSLGKQRAVKLFYVILILVFLIPAIFVFYFLNNWQAFDLYFRTIFTCPSSSASNSSSLECIGASAIYRLSFTLLCLFFLLMLANLCRNSFSVAVNEGLFCFKYLFCVALMVGLLWAPNSMFYDFSEASIYISILFMLIQAIILIDLFYLAGIRIAAKYSAGDSCCGAVLVGMTIILGATAVGLNIAGYVVFPVQECGSTLSINIITSVINTITPLLQLFNFNKQNSLLTTFLLLTYISYLSFIGQYSYPYCSRMTNGALIADTVISTLFFILTMYGSVMGGTGQVKVSQDGNVNRALGVAGQVKQGGDKDQKRNHTDVELKPQQERRIDEVRELETYEDWVWVKWHFYLCLAMVYISMLITNWTAADFITGTLQTNGYGFWVRVGLSWAATLLYLWTLIAPKVCPSRDFEVE